MQPRNTLIGVVVLAVLLLGGAWLFPERVPMTQDARKQKCVDDIHRFLSDGHLQLNDGVTWEAFEAKTLAQCRCFAREASLRLTPEELAVLDWREDTPAMAAKRAEIFSTCGSETP